MWAAVVNRQGELCAWVTSTSDPTQVWPGSQAIAKAKAYTANAFSLDTFALSTARLYTFTQPGHSLASLGQSNPFDPKFLLPANGNGSGKNQVNGGMIFFGGGVPLYRNGKIMADWESAEIRRAPITRSRSACERWRTSHLLTWPEAEMQTSSMILCFRHPIRRVCLLIRFV
jgi:uncharacterized protein GlcG (DUF336 family)